mgnify:CR=1 FL=1
MSIEVSDGVAHVQLSRPDKRNALDIPMFEALAGAGAAIAGRPDVRCVVLSGQGPSFCAGLDLTAMAAIGDASESGGLVTVDEGRITHRAQQACWVWAELPIPVIAAVHGHAIGGGIQLALAADVRVVHPDTKLSVREVYYGLIPDMTGTLTLSRLVGADVARELVYTARLFDGREAKELGVATRLSDRPVEDALALAAAIAERSPDAVRGAKSLFHHLHYADAPAAFAAERRVIGGLIGGENQREAVVAHFEQRPPRFADPVL